MDPTDFASQFTPGQRISFYLPGEGMINATFLKMIGKNSAQVQLPNGAIRIVDVTQITSAGGPTTGQFGGGGLGGIFGGMFGGMQGGYPGGGAHPGTYPGGGPHPGTYPTPGGSAPYIPHTPPGHTPGTGHWTPHIPGSGPITAPPGHLPPGGVNPYGGYDAPYGSQYGHHATYGSQYGYRNKK